MHTVDEAKKLECRVGGSIPDELDAEARVFPACAAGKCGHWRWLPHMCDEPWIAAVQKAADEIKDTSPNRARAAAHVNKNRAKYGLSVKPTHGYCGLAGKPEVLT